VPLETTFGYHHELLIGVVSFLPDVIVDGHCSVATQLTLLPLPPTVSTLCGAFDGGLGRHVSATTGGHSRINQSEGGPDILLARSVSGCDVEQFLGGFWLLVAELMNQRVARRVVPKCRDDVSVGHTRELLTFL
jgi:hypothetical protein